MRICLPEELALETVVDHKRTLTDAQLAQRLLKLVSDHPDRSELREHLEYLGALLLIGRVRRKNPDAGRPDPAYVPRPSSPSTIRQRIKSAVARGYAEEDLDKEGEVTYEGGRRFEQRAMSKLYAELNTIVHKAAVSIFAQWIVDGVQLGGATRDHLLRAAAKEGNKASSHEANARFYRALAERLEPNDTVRHRWRHDEVVELMAKTLPYGHTVTEENQE